MPSAAHARTSAAISSGRAAHRVAAVGRRAGLDPDPGREPRRRPPGRLGRGPDDRERARRRRPARRARVIAVGERPRPPERRLVASADDDRQRRLHRERPEREVVDGVEPAVERLGRARPQVTPQPDRLVEVRTPHVEPVGDCRGSRTRPRSSRRRRRRPPGRRSAHRAWRAPWRGGPRSAAGRRSRSSRDGPRVPGTDPGEGQDRLVDPAVVGRAPMRDEDVVGRPDRRPAEALGDLGSRPRCLRPRPRRGSSGRHNP